MLKQTMRCLAVTAFLCGVGVLPAEVIYSNSSQAQPSAKAPALKGPAAGMLRKNVAATAVAQTATTFTLTEPMVITAIKAPQTAPDVPTDVRILRDGKPVYTELSLKNTPNNVIVNPYLVFGPGTYTVELANGSAWKRNTTTSAGLVEIHGRKAGVGAQAAAVSAFLKTPEGTSRAFSLTEALINAKLNADDLKQNLKDQTQGLKTDMKGAKGQMAEELGQRQGGTTIGGEGKSVGSASAKAFEGMQGQGMAPSKYADTYAGQRWNSGRTGSPSNFSGGGRGHTSSGEDDADLNDTIAGMLTDAGGTVTGDPATDAAEAAYMMSVGSDGWEATKNMTQDQRKDYWSTEQNRQMLGVGRPRDDQDQGGTFTVFGNGNMRRAMFRFQAKAIEARKGQAGAAEGTSTGGGVKMPIGKDDKPMAERNQSTINWDAIFEINETINPTRD